MSKDQSKVKDSRHIAGRYDEIIFRPVHMDYFGHSDYLNFGYWDEHTTDQKQACENLMEKAP